MSRKRSRRLFGSIRPLPSKRVQASYVGPDGGRYFGPASFATKLDADSWLYAERKLIDDKKWTPPKTRRGERDIATITVSEYLATWIGERKLTSRTRDEYEAKKRLYIDATIGKRMLGDVDRRDVRSWYAGLDDKHPTAKSHAYSLLHAVFETALDDELIAVNPCRIRGAMNAPAKRAVVLLSVDEVNRLTDVMADRYKAIILLGAWCGLRWGEIGELRRKDFGAGCETITVARAVTHRNGKCSIGTVKEKQAKTVHVPPHIRADIKHHLDTFVAEGPEAQLFPAARGGCHLNDRVFGKGYFTPAVKEIGRDDAHFHDLRHFAGTSASRAGGTVREVQARLGHRTIKAAMGYQHPDEGAILAEKLSVYALTNASEGSK